MQVFHTLCQIRTNLDIGKGRFYSKGLLQETARGYCTMEKGLPQPCKICKHLRAEAEKGLYREKSTRLKTDGKQVVTTWSQAPGIKLPLRQGDRSVSSLEVYISEMAPRFLRKTFPGLSNWQAKLAFKKIYIQLHLNKGLVNSSKL